MMAEPIHKETLYSQAAGGVNPALVKGATAKEVKQYVDDDGTGIVCGECNFFERAHAQEEIQATQFIETLVREHKWKPEHLCSPTNLLGFCGASNSGAPGEDRKLTGTLHKGCDQFRRNRGRIRIKGD